MYVTPNFHPLNRLFFFMTDLPPQPPRHPLEQDPEPSTPPVDDALTSVSTDPVAPQKRHPLEQPPPAPAAPPPGSTRVNLRIPAKSPTIAYILIIANIVVFVIRLISPQIDSDLVQWGANNPVRVLEFGEYYRLFTSMFLHAGIFDGLGRYEFTNVLHLMFNMLVLYSAGTEMERFFGHVRFGLIYLFGGLTGAIFSTLLSDPNTYSIGASGAVFAILGAQLVFQYKHRRLFGVAGRARLQNTITLLAINLGYGLLANATGGPVRIDNWAHIGGALGGAALAWFIAPFYLVRRHPDNPADLLAEDINPLKGRYAAVSLYFCAMLVVLIAARLLTNNRLG
jgi:membrane associated rhomboid family serine protease